MREMPREILHCAVTLIALRRFEDVKSLLRRTEPVARRILGESHELTLRMRWAYAVALGSARDSTPDDLREATATLEDAARIARRVLGGTHPITTSIECTLRDSRAALRARETPPRGGAYEDPV